MGTKRAIKEAMPEAICPPMAMGMNVAGQVCAKEPGMPPHYEESRELLKEARRALWRAVAHAAAHDLPYDLDRPAKALQALAY